MSLTDAILVDSALDDMFSRNEYESQHGVIELVSFKYRYYLLMKSNVISHEFEIEVIDDLGSKLLTEHPVWRECVISNRR
jgi:hypothetical protein